MEEDNSDQGVSLAWMFYLWSIFTILVHSIGIGISVVYTIRQKARDHIDRYVIWEYYIIIALCFVKILSVVVSFGGRDLYGYVFILNTGYYGLFFLFELINLSKISILIGIAKFVAYLSKNHREEIGQNVKKLTSGRTRFESCFMLIFFFAISLLVTICILLTVFQAVENGKFRISKKKNIYEIDSTCDYKNEAKFTIVIVVFALASVGAVGRIVFLIKLLMIEKDTLNSIYEKRGKVTTLTVAASVLLILCMLGFLLPTFVWTWMIRIREVYLFRDDISISTERAILATFLWPLPTNLCLLLIIMANIHSVNFLKNVCTTF